MGFSLNPLNIAKDVVTAPVKIAEKAVDVAKAAPGVVKDVATEAYHTGDYLIHHPPKPSQIGRTLNMIGKAIISGEEVTTHGNLPAYSRLPQADHDAAIARGKGQSIDQKFITGDKAGKSINEPVSIEVTGSKADLVAALKKAGWNQAPKRSTGEYAEMGAKVLLGTEKDTNGPVSVQYLNGKEEEMAWNKNDDFNAGRDHMRIYNMGKDENGEQKWAIAATRDTAVKVTIPHPDVDLNPFDGDGLSIHEDTPKFTHTIDKDIDHERDYVMHDLVKSGFVKDWDAVDGKRSGVAEQKLPDGRFKVDNDLTTDGRVFRVGLHKPV